MYVNLKGSKYAEREKGKERGRVEEWGSERREKIERTKRKMRKRCEKGRGMNGMK